MGQTVGNLQVVLSASSPGFSYVIDKATRDLDVLDQKVVKSASVLHTLKQSLGGRSDFKDAFEVLRGGGAVVGLSLAGRTLAEMSGKALELKKEFFDGSKSAGEVADGLARSLPILGSIYEAGRNIHELFVGSVADGERELRVAHAINDAVDARYQSILDTVKATREFAELTKEIQQRTFANSLSGPAREQQAQLDDLANKLAAIDKAADAAIKGVSDPLSAQITKLKLELATLRTELPPPSTAKRGDETSLTGVASAVGGMTELQRVADAQQQQRRVEMLDNIARLESQIARLKKSQADDSAKIADEAGKAREAAANEFDQARAKSIADANKSFMDDILKESGEFWDKLSKQQEETLISSGESLAESLRTPLEKFNADMATYKNLLEHSAITQETFDRAAARAREGLGGVEGDRTLTVQARRFTFSAPAAADDRGNRMEKLAAEQLAQQKKTATAAEQTAKAIEDGLFDVITLN